jgi:hypothetical protein
MTPEEFRALVAALLVLPAIQTGASHDKVLDRALAWADEIIGRSKVAK